MKKCVFSIGFAAFAMQNIGKMDVFIVEKAYIFYIRLVENWRNLHSFYNNMLCE